MPDKTTDFLILILRILSENHDKSLSLDELENYVSLQQKNCFENGKIAQQLENQSIILDHLILLDSQGLIFLDPETDRSSITAEGSQKLNSNILINHSQN